MSVVSRLTAVSHSALASYMRAHAHDATLSNRNVHETFHPSSIFPRMLLYYIYLAYTEYTHSYTYYALLHRLLICRIVHFTYGLSLAKFKNTHSEINSAAVIHFTYIRKWRPQPQTHTKAYSTAKQYHRLRNRS